MSKVTDMMYDLIFNAHSRDDSYVSVVDAVFEKHRSTTHDLLDGDELAGFLSRLHHDIHNLKAMLRAKVSLCSLSSSLIIPPASSYESCSRLVENYLF
ncbi:hypothetical protein Pint_28537 [Pistacia integerrima]|uniref:Uncharacterized protein n=1 Tax=Pistacia integerrima TaxID=434235 RepID=A0ACC0YS06_9ROSI|nr:hypothetical protein Pint_28537 [Pistacia integerrima]